MKKSLHISVLALILLMNFALYATLAYLLACDGKNLSDSANTQNISAETVSITAETDFEKLESDKVSFEDFNKMYTKFMEYTFTYFAGNKYPLLDVDANFTYQSNSYTNNVSSSNNSVSPSHNSFTVKKDGLKTLNYSAPESLYAVSSADFKNCTVFDENGNVVRRYNESEIKNNRSRFNKDYNDEFFEITNAKFNYNESTKSYKYGNEYGYAEFKIKSGYIVYFKEGTVNGEHMDIIKFYDIGSTKVELPFEYNGISPTNDDNTTENNDGQNSGITITQDIIDTLALSKNGTIEYSIGDTTNKDFTRGTIKVNNGKAVDTYELHFDSTRVEYGTNYYFLFDENTYIVINEFTINESDGYNIFSREEYFTAFWNQDALQIIEHTAGDVSFDIPEEVMETYLSYGQNNKIEISQDILDTLALLKNGTVEFSYVVTGFDAITDEEVDGVGRGTIKVNNGQAVITCEILLHDTTSSLRPIYFFLTDENTYMSITDFENEPIILSREEYFTDFWNQDTLQIIEHTVGDVSFDIPEEVMEVYRTYCGE